MAAIRVTLAALLLMMGALNALLAFTLGTCTMGSADSLTTGVLTVVFNLLAFTLIPRATGRSAMFAIALLPGLVAVGYTFFAVKLGIGHVGWGMTSCEAMSGLPYEADGREPWHIVIWLAAGLSFWVGFARALWHAAPSTGVARERAEQNRSR